MMQLLRRLFHRPLPTVPPETPHKKEEREFRRRIIEEHREANDRGRQLVAEQIKANTLRYGAALDSAMKIMGER